MNETYFHSHKSQSGIKNWLPSACSDVRVDGEMDSRKNLGKFRGQGPGAGARAWNEEMDLIAR